MYDVFVFTLQRPVRLCRYYNPEKLPKPWIPMDTRTPEVYECTVLPSNSRACRTTRSAFYQTMTSHNIRKIYRIQNLTHWNKYLRYLFLTYSCKNMTLNILT